LPRATERVFSDDRPAFVFVTDAQQVPLQATLDARGIAYESRLVNGYLIVHPTNAWIDPATVVEELTFGP
jgi:hypothetical protein